jgi:hypothetical protein
MKHISDNSLLLRRSRPSMPAESKDHPGSTLVNIRNKVMWLHLEEKYKSVAHRVAEGEVWKVVVSDWWRTI